MSTEPEWLAPASLDEALALRAERRDGATVVAGGTFVGILVNSRLIGAGGVSQPAACCRAGLHRAPTASSGSAR